MSSPPLFENLLPCAISEHGPDTPRRAKDVESLGEAIVVNKTRVNGEDAHEEDEIAPVEEGIPDLASGRQRGRRSASSEPGSGERDSSTNKNSHSKARRPRTEGPHDEADIKATQIARAHTP